ncbi:Carboxylesterase notum2 [Collichthys lucidus]|uniref:5-demethoxyubiquinone hydroxylase, mitochondrial n=1 Tax=Collichthys lucidus TaxID=240159 RepID=A0A4U5U2Z9_COLLU|nr:Carboxylesterase notum2 [Collichthys lucidus]
MVLEANYSLCTTVPLQLSSRAYSVVPTPRDSGEKDMLDRMMRVDHAGEYGANRIYAGQMAVLGRSRTGPLIQQMWDQEKKHLQKFNEILAENRVRPTALLPLWNVAGFVLGASTALLGKEGAMACTVAVEESISEHYNSQIRALMEKDPERYTELLQYLPSRCVVSSLSQALAGAPRENGRKSDPYGGTIKLTADLRASSKPGQGFITTDDWHPPLTPGHCTLNFSASPQQHQLSARSLKLILLRENNRNAKASGKATKKTGGNQGADVGQSTSVVDLTPESTGTTRSTGGTGGNRGSAEAGQEGAAGARTAEQPTDDMRLHFLRNNQVTCNDGTAAGFIPYCSSDVWSGTGPAPTPPPRLRQGREKERDRIANATEYTFMGSLIVREVIKDLIPKGIKQAKVVMLSGTSAGGTGVLLNIERVASQLEQLGADAQVRGLVDSGWFLESKQQRSPNCPETISCSPEDAIKIGLRLWNGVVPDRCRQLYKRGEEWQCFFGHKLYSTLTSPLFVVQWLFDEEQLRVENIYMGGQSLSQEQWQYIQNLGRELKNSLRDVTAVFAPSCLSHTVITKSNWMSFQVRGTSLPRALQCWDRSLEATRNNRTPAKGCPFHLVDTCQTPQCNPTCPALVDQATQQELTLLQMLVAMGLDLQKLGLDPQGDADSLASMANGG